MTDSEMFELFTLIDTLGVRPHDKVEAIKRLESKGLVARVPGRAIVVTSAALEMLGKMRIQ